MKDVRNDVPIDLTFAWLPFEEMAIARAVQLPFATGVIRVPRVEDLLVYKLVAARPRDLDDVERLLAIHRAIDLEQVRRPLVEFAEALAKPELIATFERLTSEK